MQTSAESASGGLDSLIESLDSLKRAVKGGAGLTTVTKQLSTLNTALSGFDSQNVGKIREIANGLKDLSSIGTVNIPKNLSSQIQSIGNATNSLSKSGLAKIGTMVDSLNMISRVKPSNLTSAVNALNKLPSALQGIQNFGTSNVGSEIQSLVSALSPLGQMDKSALGSYISQLRKLPEVIQELKSLDMGLLESQIKGVANAFSPLAKEMQSIANGFSALPSRIQTLIKSTDKLPEVNNRTAKSYVNLAAKMTIILYTVQRVTSVLAGWITESLTYTETLNMFAVSMGEYANQAGEFIELVSDKMGIDPEQWMRFQASIMSITRGFGVAGDRAYTMSQNLTQLIYDLSSLKNAKYEDAFLKVQSAIAGELEPLRAWGYDLSVARLQQEALNLGIEKSVNAMTQAEKAELRYYAIMTQVTFAQGDMARTLEAPANQLRVLRAAVTQAARALGNIFIPIINMALPYVIALAKVVKLLADVIAGLVGFTLPEVDYSGIGNAAAGAGDLSDNLGDAAGNAQDLKKSLLGIDELNLLSAPSDTGGGAGGAGVGGGGGLGFELPTYDFIGDAVKGKADEIVAKIKEWLGLTEEIDSWSELMHTRLGRILTTVAAIGAAFAGWKIAKSVIDFIPMLSNLSKGGKLGFTLGVALTVGGIVLEGSGLLDAIQNELNSMNFTQILTGGGALTAGGALIGKTFGSALIGGAAGAILAGVPAFITGVYDALKNGIDWLSASLIGLSATAVGAGVGVLIGALGGPIGAGIGALIGLAIGLVTDFSIWLYQNWESVTKWFSGSLEAIGQFFVDFGQGIIQVAIDTKDSFLDAFGQFVDFSQSVVTSVGNFFSNMWSMLVDGAKSAWEGIKSTFSTVAQFFKNIFTEAWQGVVNVFSIGGTIFIDIRDSIVVAFKNVVNQLINGLNHVIAIPFNGINNALNYIKGFSIMGVRPFAGIGNIGVPQIPYLATGGQVDQGQLFVANEAGAEMIGTMGGKTTVANNEQIVEGIRLGVRDATAEQNALLREQNALLREMLESGRDIILDGKSVAKEVTRYQRQMSRAMGV